MLCGWSLDILGSRSWLAQIPVSYLSFTCKRCVSLNPKLNILYQLMTPVMREAPERDKLEDANAETWTVEVSYLRFLTW